MIQIKIQEIQMGLRNWFRSLVHPAPLKIDLSTSDSGSSSFIPEPSEKLVPDEPVQLIEVPKDDPFFELPDGKSELFPRARRGSLKSDLARRRKRTHTVLRTMGPQTVYQITARTGFAYNFVYQTLHYGKFRVVGKVGLQFVYDVFPKSSKSISKVSPKAALRLELIPALSSLGGDDLVVGGFIEQYLKDNGRKTIGVIAARFTGDDRVRAVRIMQSLGGAIKLYGNGRESEYLWGVPAASDEPVVRVSEPVSVTRYRRRTGTTITEILDYLKNNPRSTGKQLEMALGYAPRGGRRSCTPSSSLQRTLSKYIDYLRVDGRGSKGDPYRYSIKTL